MEDADLVTDEALDKAQVEDAENSNQKNYVQSPAGAKGLEPCGRQRDKVSNMELSTRYLTMTRV